VSHLFLTCKIVNAIWNLCHFWFGEATVSHNEPKHNFRHFVSLILNKNANNAWVYANDNNR